MAKISALIDQFIDFEHKDDPFLATRRGDYNYESEIFCLSNEKIKERRMFYNQLKLKVESVSLDNDVKAEVDKKLLLILINDKLRELNIIKPFETNPGYYAAKIMSITHIMLSRDYQDINKRLTNLEIRLKKCIPMLEKSKEVINNPNPELTKQAILQAKKAGIKYFSKKVYEIIQAQNGNMSYSLNNTFKDIVKSLEKHIEYLKNVLPEASGKFAIGEEIYNEYLKNSYLLDYTNEELISKGYELLASTKEKMVKLAFEIDKELSWQEIIEKMKLNHPSANDLLETYRKELNSVKQFVIENQVASFPENEELIIIETPEHMRSLFPYAGYSRPATFDKFQSGRFWVTPIEEDMSKEEKDEKLKEHMYYKIPVFVLHEGYPGHHLQITTQQNIDNKIRKIFHNNLYVEGWAFYCEELLENLGYISDLKTKLSQLKDQLWRASRIIIDASLHSEKMSFDEAVDFLVENAFLERSNAFAEVSRYIQNPLRPMSYLIGKLELIKIADEYKIRKGKQFNMLEFHNKLLSLGAIPPKLVKKELFN